MLEKWERVISCGLGIRGVHINAALVSAQQRKRIYWSNIRVKSNGEVGLFPSHTDEFEMPTLVTDIPQPKDKEITIKDILQTTAEAKYYMDDDATRNIMHNTNAQNLKDYLNAPQVNIGELTEYIKSQSSIAEEEAKELARLVYDKEVQHIKAKANETYGVFFHS